MPRSVRWLSLAWAQLLGLPDVLYKEGLAAASTLMVDPFPDDAVVDPEIPDTYVLRRGMVRVYYRVVAEDNDQAVDVVGIWPNS